MKASIVELKLTEVDNEFSTYPAALSVELRQLNNKLAIKEEENRLDLLHLQTWPFFYLSHLSHSR